MGNWSTSPTSNSKDTRYLVILTVLWFGTLWGAIEALLGGLLHLLLPPTFPGKIMLGVAIGLTIFAAQKTGKPWIPAAMAIIAGSLKLFSAVIFQLPVNAPAILNPAFAIVAEGLSVTLMITVSLKLSATKPIKLTAVGLGSGLLQAIIFAGLVKGPGLVLFPSMTVINELGTKFPHWALTLDGIKTFLVSALPTGILVSGAAGLFVSLLPLKNVRLQTKVNPLLAQMTIWLVIFFAASTLL